MQYDKFYDKIEMIKYLKGGFYEKGTYNRGNGIYRQ